MIKIFNKISWKWLVAFSTIIFLIGFVTLSIIKVQSKEDLQNGAKGDKRLNSEVVLKFDDIRMPSEAMDQFSKVVGKVEDQSTKDELFRKLLSWLESNSSSAVQFYGNINQVVEAMDKEKSFSSIKEVRLLIEEVNNMILMNSGAINSSNISDSDFREVVRLMAENGLVFATAEGDIWPVLSYQYLNERFSDILSSQFQDYLEIRSARLNMFDEWVLTLSWNQLASHIVRLENFMRQYPNSEEYEVVERYYNLELEKYLSGSYSNKISKKLKESYLDFLENYQNTDTAFLVKEYYDLLEKNDFNKNKEVYEFIDRVSRIIPLKVDEIYRIYLKGDFI